MKKSLKFMLSFLIVAIAVMPFVSINAVEKPTISMNTGGDFYVGESQEFTISTEVPEGYGDVMVRGTGGLSDPSAIEKIEYYEVKDGNWYELPADGNFGSSEGFKLQNTSAKFRVTFKKEGEYSATYKVVGVSDGKTIAENTLNIKVIDKSVRDVSTESEFNAALNDNNVKTINIVKDFTTSAKINITRDVTINGNAHKLTMNLADKTTWGGHYVLQVYRSNVTINDITLSGANAGLLVNGGNATLKGKIDVSNNGFGGIELSGSNPVINLSGATLVNSTEEYLKPTLWIDPKMDNVVVEYAGFKKNIEVDKGDHLQTQYYLDAKNTLDTADNQIKEEISNGSTIINIEVKENDVISAEVLNELKNGPAREIVINTETVTISFNTKNITDSASKDLSLNVDVVKEQPFNSNLLNSVKSDLLFVDLEYEGVLPKDTKISFKTGSEFKVGDKLYLYYYNPNNDKIELVADDIVVDENNVATIELDHASTYILSAENISSVNNTENPNTSDFTMYMVIVLGVVALLGFGYVLKTKFVNK